MLSFLHAGEGPTLVLIHGVGLRAEAWDRMMPGLAAHFSIYAVDMPGHGATPLGKVQVLEDYVDAVARFVVVLRGPVFVAGHSFGAILAMKLAARQGTDIAGIAALNAIYRRTPEAEKAVRARAAAIVAGEGHDPAPTVARWFGEAPQGALKTAARDCNAWLGAVDQTGYGRAYTAFAHQDGPSKAELQAIKCPALFMTGAQDRNSTPQMSQMMAAGTPHGRAKSLKEAAHMMPMTHPEAVTAALIDTFQTAQVP